MMSSQEVPQGYKQTKVGVVPVEWEEYRLNDILNLTLEPLKMEDDKEYELITVRRRFGGIDSRGLFKGKEILVKNQFYVRENNFVISKRQISHGACGLVPKELDGAIVSNEYNVFQPNIELLNQEFFNYYVRLSKFSQTFYNYSDGVHIEKLLFKTQSWLKQKIPFPPLKEQQKIAQIFTTWDKAIEKLEALIEEKERLKKGLMQRLLSGEVRFGVATLVADKKSEDYATKVASPEWEEVRLTEVVNCLDNKRIPLNKQERQKMQGNIPYYGSTSIVDYINDYIFDEDIVLISEDGGYFYEFKTRPIAFYITGKSWVNNHVHIIKNKNDSLDLKFLYYSLVHKNITAFLNGGIRAKLNKKDLLLLKLKLPPLKEQQKIAQVLTSADKEIELLKKELEALKEQKRGLMQRLLTGEVRV